MDNQYVNNQAQFCIKCGAKQNPGDAFCPYCGQPVNSSQTNIQMPSGMYPQANMQPVSNLPYASDITGGYLPPEFPNGVAPTGYVSKREYMTKYLPKPFVKEIRTCAIVCYIIGALNIAMAAINNLPYWGYIGAILISGIALGMQLLRSEVMAILLLILGIAEVITGIVMFEQVTGTLWLFVGISAVATFSKINKNYKTYMSMGNMGQIYQ